MSTPLSIGVGTDKVGWYRQVLTALRERIAEGLPIQAIEISMDAHDWLTKTEGLDALIWNPKVMGPVTASLFKERVFFLENYRGIRVMPNYRTTWHFESKVAQSYLFDYLQVPHPRTIVSFDYHDAAAAVHELGLPLVAKRSHGASGSNVWLIRSRRDLDRHLQREFAHQLWVEHKSGERVPGGAAWLLAPWFRGKVAGRIAGRELHGYVYLQEFIEGNEGDLRIFVAGRRAAGAWRLNRENDFRASGSGRGVWDRPIPEDLIRLCIDTTKRMGADSLAYDLLFRNDQPIIIEVSYSMPDWVIHRCGGYWVAEPDGQLTRINESVWPQDLWVMELMEERGLGT